LDNIIYNYYNKGFFLSNEKKYTCIKCNRKFDDHEYNNTQDDSKCILHSEKDNWYDINNGKKDWIKSNKEIGYFWHKVREVIKNRNEDEYFQQGGNLDFSSTIFPIFEKEYVQEEEFDENETLITNWESNFTDINISRSLYPEYNFTFGLSFNGSIFLDDVDFSNYHFKNNVNFNDVIFKGGSNFTNTKFSEVSFKNVTFYNKVLFENTELNSYSYKSGDFENSIFYNHVKFINVIFGSEKNKNDFDLDFTNTIFTNAYFDKCTFTKGMRFRQNTKINFLNVKNIDIDKLYIGAKVHSIFIEGNKHSIERFLIKDKNFDNLLIYNYIIKSDFILNGSYKNDDNDLRLRSINLSESIFVGKVKIQFYDIEKRAIFYNTKFEDLADFYQTKFIDVIFERTDFKGVTVFSESEFYCDIDFKYTKFLGKSIFRDTVITGSLNLRDSIFNEEANFLDITSVSRKITGKNEFIGESKDIIVANRETARVIKNLFDNMNNIIEANRFYKLEMKEREKEVGKNKENILESLVFKFHGWSSNHSQDWLLSLYWIISLTLGASFIKFLNPKFNTLAETLLASFTIMALMFLININFVNWRKSNSFVVILIYTMLYCFVTKDYTFKIFSNLINPFSIMTHGDSLTFGLLCFKLVIGYLLYQFIISLRQNTRRK
jgi:uncharacterized protein YjbI with pentapeptide repeats